MKTSMAGTFRLGDDSYELQDLLTEIHKAHTHPEDVFEVVALLESFGWTDRRVRDKFGLADVFELGRVLWRMDTHPIGFGANEFIPKPGVWRTVADSARQFVRGTVFALPMVLSIAAMLTLHFSLWSYQYLSVNLATAIALGTILSFLTVGGFMQAIARRAYFYIFQRYYKMAQRVTFRFIRTGVLTSIVISALLLWLNTLFPVLPFSMLSVAVAFYIILNAIWLSVTVMYVLQKEIYFTGLLVLGIGLVWVGFRVIHLNIIVAQLSAMVTISLVGMLVVQWVFRRSANRLEEGIQPALPRPGLSVYSVLPYFVYGFLYFLLLFIDRLMAWSTFSSYEQYLIWFRGDYEVGLDFALITLVIPLGVSEVIVSYIMNQAVLAQKQYQAKDTRILNHRFLHSYRTGFVWMVLASVLSGVIVYFSVKWLLDNYLETLNQNVQLTPISNYVFVVGLISYSILAGGLLNSVTMFSLSRPDMVIRPLLLAVGVNLMVGFLLSRWIGYADAVWGIFAGSVLFTLLTTRNIQQVIRTFDYHLYLLS